MAWRVETVDDGFLNTDSTGIALGPDNEPHFSYSATPPSGGLAVWYAQRVGLDWHTEIVDTSASNSNIVVDSDGEPHLVYRRNRDRNEVAYATPDGSGAWSIETVDPLGVGTPVIAIGSGDSVHVLYEAFEADNIREVRYAFKAPMDETWTIETIQSKDVFTMGIAVDTTGTPQVVYNTLSGPPDTIRYAKRAPDGTWQIEILDHCRGVVGIDTDLLNRPHVVCESKDGLQYHHKTDDEWTRETVSDGSNILPNRSPSDTGLEPSIAVDSQLTPHITFRTRISSLVASGVLAPTHPYYATVVDGDWWIETVDRDGEVNGFRSDIALDDQDRPHISYILGWREVHGSPSDPWNAFFDLRYATPLVGSVAGAVGH